ncbi:hypothetical protein DMC30DRAFT_92764 [Rhodotorula diobovata]|uniref:PLC-like phosphodiesterase n=1 Tax=Rhodotorula diobovata TaxID=5288 RepID=A0A5C5FM20_9BASI|nr:hypothetical protein DMC30DRAFT_92764 [Rhodotorula diobovata]
MLLPALAAPLLLSSLAIARPPQTPQLPLSAPSRPHQGPEVGRRPRGEYRMLPGYSPYPGGISAPELRMPTGFSRNIPERRIHSHNDYWRDVPVDTALSHGVLSIEADVWLNPRDDVLYVSHSVAALTRARTFSRLQENERERRRPWTSFYEGNLTPIQLLVDLKTRGNETYHAVLRELEPLRQRGWLTTWNGTHVVPGPVKVLLTGNGINADVRAQVAPARERDVFLDAPLLQLDDIWQGLDGLEYGWNSTLAPMACVPPSLLFTSALSPLSQFFRRPQVRLVLLRDELDRPSRHRPCSRRSPPFGAPLIRSSPCRRPSPLGVPASVR